MRVAALQYDISSDPEQNLAFVRDQLAVAADDGIGLVLLPEMWASSFPSAKTDLAARVDADRRNVDVLRELADKLQLCVGGSALASAGPKVVNRMEFFERGETVFTYDKVHLFTPTAEHEIFDAGELAPQIAVVGAESSGALRLSGAVCYDLRFPELFRVPFRDGVEVLCVSAQWPAPRIDHWVALCTARAIENQCFVLSSNRTGEAFIGRRKMRLEFPGSSMVVSPYGEVLAKGTAESGLVAADIELDQARQFRVRVPVAKDERPDLYRKWLEGPKPE